MSTDSKGPAPYVEQIDVTMNELEKILERAKERPLSDEDRELLHQVFVSYFEILDRIGDRDTTMKRLRQLLFGSGSEKLTKLFEDNAGGSDSADENDALGENDESGDSGKDPDPGDGPQGSSTAAQGDGAKDAPGESSRKEPRKGHGRNAADTYEGATRVRILHESLEPGGPCPKCAKGRVYERSRPGVFVRIVAEPPLQATVYELQKLRCNLCGEVFTANPPPVAGNAKYDATCAAMIALLKYGTGVPFYRIEGLERHLGVPLPASTQWDLVREVARDLEPAFEELIRQGAQGEVVYNDDTAMRILALRKENEERARAARRDGSAASKRTKPRTGVFTSGIVSTREGRRIALFFSGRQHAGENLADVLARRACDLDPPKHMCDGLSRNLPGELRVILGNCLAHGRRKFVEIVDRFPEKCRHVLEQLALVYKNDEEARQGKRTPAERLALHQEKSAPILEALQSWLEAQVDEKLVEPNSALGKAIAYLQKRWEKLTLFLREPGAPLDNNICEQALKKVILHRKNALFYKTLNGARVGDLFMSLIHTCQLGAVNPFDYLTELARHTRDLARTPADWLPWNYRQTLDRLAPDP